MRKGPPYENYKDLAAAQKILQDVANRTCDYLELHDAIWPTVIFGEALDAPAWTSKKEREGDYGAVDWGNYDASPEVWVNATVHQKENASAASTVVHEISHIWVRYGWRARRLGKDTEEDLVCLFERILYDCMEGGVY